MLRHPGIAKAASTKRCHVQAAVRECQEKHKRMNAMSYGQLKYVLLIATAASTMEVLAIPVDNPAGIQHILPPIQVPLYYHI